MRVITKALTALLTIALLMSVISPAFAKSDNAGSTVSQQNSPSLLSELSKLKAPELKNIHDINKILHELSLFENKVIKIFEKKLGAQFVSNPNPTTVGSVNKQLTPNADGTWTVTIVVTVPAGLTANVFDYLTNLVPISGTFNPQPNVVFDGQVQYYNLGPGTHTLTFRAQQIVRGPVADQVFVNTFSSDNPSGFIFRTLAIGLSNPAFMTTEDP